MYNHYAMVGKIIVSVLCQIFDDFWTPSEFLYKKLQYGWIMLLWCGGVNDIEMNSQGEIKIK